MSLAEVLAESGAVPDAWIRAAIRGLLGAQLARARARGEFTPEAQARLRERLRSGPIASFVEAANEQHYEVPAAFFQLWLGPRMKYSCGLWPAEDTTLAQSEDAMLALTCERAGLEDGMAVLELGSGWGSLSLWIASHYPRSTVLAVSNSESQVAFVRARAAAMGLTNVTAQRADARVFETERRFDRVVSVEMFEHLRNHEAMLARVARWLNPGGRLFVHVFAHRELAYLYETDEAESWMARHFFTGGVMPSEALLPSYDRDLVCTERWTVSGLDYSRTLEAWLVRLDSARAEAIAALAETPGPGHGDARRATRQWRRWRIFLMACSELFAWHGGDTWRVAHYLFAPGDEASPGRASTS